MLALSLLAWVTPVTAKPSQACVKAISTAEQAYDLPPYLLQAISQMAVELAANPDEKLDVQWIGCLGLNQAYHRASFSHDAAMLAVEANVDYAAQYLRSLYSHYRNWRVVLELYYQANDSPQALRQAKDYTNQVYRLWRENKRTRNDGKELPQLPMIQLANR